jgi:putative chitinase
MESAAPYARNPEALANKVYSNRMGNGENEGGLWVGRGFIQLTGKANYRSFASDMGLPDIMTDPDLVATEYAFESAMWFFESNGLFEMADDGVNDSVITSISKRVNGGTHGLDDRMEQTKKIHSWIAHVGV